MYMLMFLLFPKNVYSPVSVMTKEEEIVKKIYKDKTERVEN